MAAAPLPTNEKTRLAYLEALAVLDTAPEPAFDRFVHLARHITGAPIALVSLVDAERQWFKARAGLEAEETPREEAFCAHAILEDEILVVANATADPRFADNPLVRGEPGVRFYAGAPLVTHAGNLGTLCVLDTEPRTLSTDQRSALKILAGTVVDQLEQRILERRARRRLRWLYLAEELGKIGHWRVLTSDRSLFWSPEVYSIHGRDPATFEPELQDGIDAYHPDDRDSVHDLVHGTLEKGEPFEFERRLVRPGGEIRWVRAIGRPELDAEGRVTSVFGVFHDVTDQKLLQSEMLHRETLSSLGLMAATMAHEINNPLASMQLNADALATFLGGEGTSADAKAAVADLHHAIGRVRRLTDELRSVARPASLGMAEVEPRRVLDAALRLVGFRLDEVRVEVALTDDLPTVHCNEAKCVQVLMNLLVNAADAMADSTRPRVLSIRGGSEGEGVWLEVADNGAGMAPEVATHAFEPFYTTKTEGQGTGLGLYVCRQAVESLGGSIALDSTEGEGTTVRVELPRFEQPAAEAPVEAEEPRAAGTERRVLIIDDNAMVGRALERALRGRGVEVLADPEQALERLLHEGERYGAIVCDLAMPVLSGPELYERAVAERPELEGRFLFITGGTPHGDAHAFMESQRKRVFVKPLDMRSLTAAIDALL